MSEMQEVIIQSTTKLLKDKCTKEVLDEVENGLWPDKLWNTLLESGLHLIGIDEEKGGVGGDYSDTFEVIKLIGKFAIPLPLFELMFVNWIISNKDLDVENELVTTCINQQINATSEDGKVYINGKIENIPWARHANKILINLKVDQKDYLTMIEKSDLKIIEKNNLAGEALDEVIIEKVQLNQNDLIELNDNDYEYFIAFGALAKSAMISGALDKVLETSLTYMAEREQFGRPLYKLQAVQQNLAILAGQVVSSNTMTNHAINTFDNNFENKEATIGKAKIVANEAASQVANIAHQLHGAIGVTHEHELQHFTRRLWTWRDQFGNENYWSNILSHQLIHNDNSLWASLTE